MLSINSRQIILRPAGGFSRGPRENRFEVVGWGHREIRHCVSGIYRSELLIEVVHFRDDVVFSASYAQLHPEVIEFIPRNLSILVRVHQFEEHLSLTGVFLGLLEHAYYFCFIQVLAVILVKG